MNNDDFSIGNPLRFPTVGPLQGVLDGIPDPAIILLDPEGCVLTWPPAAERLKGWHGEEILGKSFRIFYSEEDLAAGTPQKELDAATRQGQLEVRGWRMRKDGKRFWAHAVLTAIRDHQGTPLGFGKSIRDLTEATQAEATIRSQALELKLLQGELEARVLRNTENLIQANKALRDSEAHYRTVFEGLNDVILVHSRAGRILDANPRAEELLGFTRSELLGLSLADLQDSHPDPLALLEEIRVKGSTVLETSYRRKDGRSVPVEISCRETLMGGQAVITGVVRDLRSRHEAEEILLESEHRFRQVLETIDLLALTLDRSGRITFCNPCLLELAGWTLDEVVGQDWFALFTPPALNRRQFYENAMAMGGIHPRTQTDLVLRNGDLRQVVWNNTNLRDYRGIQLGTASIGEDVTALRKAEAALIQSEEKYRTLTERLHEGLAITDAEGNFSYCNPHLARLLGYGDGEAAGLDHLLPNPLSRDGQAKPAPDPSGPVACGQDEAHLRRKDGSTMEVLITESPLVDEAQRYRGSLVLVTDNTERKRLEALLRQTQKAESLALMASGVAHDFNNLFQSLLGHLEVARANTRNPDKLASALDKTLRVVDKAAALSSRMLEYSGKGFFQSKGVDLGSVLRTNQYLLQDLCLSSCTLTLALEDPFPEVSGDPQQLLQVVAALVCNAAEAATGGSGSSIRIAGGSRELGAADLLEGYWATPGQAGSYTVLSVKDHGCGMDAPTLAKAFDPFFSTKCAGRGLGLSSALGILQAHHASLQVLTGPGQGTEMRIHFPSRAVPVPATSVPTPLQATTQGQKTILLVDDDEDLRMSLAEILESILGYAVLQARDGREGVELFRSSPGVDLILMDATMPGMNGGEAFDSIRAANPSARAILCSGFSENMGCEEAFKHGFLGFLKKPFSLKTLQETLEKALPRTG